MYENPDGGLLMVDSIRKQRKGTYRAWLRGGKVDHLQRRAIRAQVRGKQQDIEAVGEQGGAGHLSDTAAES